MIVFLFGMKIQLLSISWPRTNINRSTTRKACCKTIFVVWPAE